MSHTQRAIQGRNEAKNEINCIFAQEMETNDIATPLGI